METKGHYFTISGHKVYAGIQGGGHARSIVFVHGICVSNRYMRPLARELADRYNIYLIDMPGFGKSSKPLRRLTLDELSAILREFITLNNIRQPMLFANSFGCQICIRLLRDSPEIARAAMLVGPTFTRYERTTWHQAIRLTQDIFREPPSLILVLLKDLWDCGIIRIFRTLFVGLADKPEQTVRHITLPLLFVRGQHDPLAPRPWVEELSDAAPNGTMKEVANAAHALNYNSPKQMASIIDEFMAR